MIMDKYGSYVRKFMWQLCGWGGVDICMTFHMRAFDVFFLYRVIINDCPIAVGVENPHKFWIFRQPRPTYCVFVRRTSPFEQKRRTRVAHTLQLHLKVLMSE
jgi:hypothetical protein